MQVFLLKIHASFNVLNESYFQEPQTPAIIQLASHVSGRPS